MPDPTSNKQKYEYVIIAFLGAVILYMWMTKSSCKKSSASSSFAHSEPKRVSQQHNISPLSKDEKKKQTVQITRPPMSKPFGNVTVDEDSILRARLMQPVLPTLRAGRNIREQPSF